MSLLSDFGDFIKTPEGQGLLSGVFGYAANAQRGTPINNLGRGGVAGLLGYSNAQDRKSQEATDQQRQKLWDAQLQNYQAQADAQKAEIERQKMKQGYLGSLVQGTAPVQSVVFTPEANAERANQPVARRAFDPAEAIRNGYSIEEAQKLASMQDWGRSEVARTVELNGPDGRKLIVQKDKFGRTVGDGMDGYVAPVQVNQGNKITFATPASGLSFAVGMSPSERDASARGWAGVRQAEQRLKMDQGQGAYTFNAELGGYVPKTPGAAFVPLNGAPKNPKLTESEAKSSLYLSQMREATSALEKLGKDSGPVGVAMTGNSFTNILANDADQAAGQAQRQWAEAYLRAKTGAAATAGEVDNNIRTFFPVIGDSDATKLRKSQARAAAENDMQIPAGRGANQVSQQSNAPMQVMPPAYQHKGKTIRDTQTGKTLRSDGMSWKEVQ